MGEKGFILFVMNRCIRDREKYIYKYIFFLLSFFFGDKIFFNDRSLRFTKGVTG